MFKSVHGVTSRPKLSAQPPHTSTAHKLNAQPFLRNPARLFDKNVHSTRYGNPTNGLIKKNLEVVFLTFEVWVKDWKVFDLRFSFSMSKSPRGQVLS